MQDQDSQTIIVDTRALDDMLVRQDKILRRLDSIDEILREHGHKLDELFTAPLLTADIVGNDDQLMALAPSIKNWQREGAVRGDDAYSEDERDTVGCDCLCAVFRDWYLYCRGRQ